MRPRKKKENQCLFIALFQQRQNRSAAFSSRHLVSDALQRNIHSGQWLPTAVGAATRPQAAQKAFRTIATVTIACAAFPIATTRSFSNSAGQFSFRATPAPLPCAPTSAASSLECRWPPVFRGNLPASCFIAA